MIDNRNTILAVILSGLVLIGWQYFYNLPQMEKRRAAEQAQSEQAKQAQQAGGDDAARRRHATGATAPAANAPATQPAAAGASSAATPPLPRRPRIKIDTPRISGSIALKGARIDDLSLVQFRETVDPASPAIVLFSPSGTADPYYAEFGWVAGDGSAVKMPDQNTPWQQEGSGSLTPSTPVTLNYDNGEGLVFHRTIAIDDRYLFTIKDEVSNVGSAPVTLYPFALISRHGTPQVAGYYILHEGLVGYLGDRACRNTAYKKIDDAKSVNFKVTDGWLGITDKYWASALLPDTRHNSTRASRPISSATCAPIRPTIWRIRRPSRPAAPAAPMRGCSPAPRKRASSASTSRSAGSAATTRSSASTISTC